MQLDVIVPTYNRHHLLKLTLQSLLAAEIPAGLSVHVTVVDNNSTDQTQQTVTAFKPLFGGRLNYVFERNQGRSPALNAGIAATDGDLVGMVDDDEEIDKSWYACVYQAFSNENIDFIGGSCIPRWGAEPPSWLRGNNSGVIGSIESQHSYFYGTNDAILMGGNVVLTRSILHKVGLYSTDLGRKGLRPLADEDTDMYFRLLAAGARGMYLPDLIISHYIHPERLTKRYFRDWHFWRGVSSGVLDKRHPKDTAYLLGIPRYLFGRAMRGSFRILGTTVGMNRDPAQSFSDELKLWDVAGFFYGKHFYKAAR
jgi:glycosyltransferase involved in cell wall biosynthesis